MYIIIEMLETFVSNYQIMHTYNA